MQIEITTEYLHSQGLSETFQKRFWSKVQKTPGCWLWLGRIHGNGYGTINRFGSNVRISAHRASWIIHFSPIPKGLHVLHNCPGDDNRACVNPGHLYIGTNVDNGRDRALKGQASSGENRYNHKLTWPDVQEIRRNPKGGQDALASRFGVSQSLISAVLLHKTWKLR